MKKVLLLAVGFLLVGCQSVNHIGGKKLKKFEPGISHEERKEINNWVSSEYTNSYIKSKNFNHRKPNVLVLHHTDSNEDSMAIKIFKEGKVSSHYLISRTGEIFQFVDEKNRAFHAGDSYWNGFEDINSSSIGIELSNDMKTPYTEEQIQSLIILSKDIIKRYGIRKDMVVGHLDVAPVRKLDPYVNFPWERLAQEGICITCNEEYKKVEIPKHFNWKAAMAEIGYNPNYLEKAVYSFRIKYFHKIPDEKYIEPNLDEKKYIYCLLEKFRESRK
mgnify:CR=1 FL=1